MRWRLRPRWSQVAPDAATPLPPALPPRRASGWPSTTPPAPWHRPISSAAVWRPLNPLARQFPVFRSKTPSNAIVDARVVDTPLRSAHVAVQTPQIFRRDVLSRALALSDDDVTDEAALAEQLGIAGRRVRGRRARVQSHDAARLRAGANAPVVRPPIVGQPVAVPPTPPPARANAAPADSARAVRGSRQSARSRPVAARCPDCSAPRQPAWPLHARASSIATPRRVHPAPRGSARRISSTSAEICSSVRPRPACQAAAAPSVRNWARTGASQRFLVLAAPRGSADCRWLPAALRSHPRCAAPGAADRAPPRPSRTARARTPLPVDRPGRAAS